MYTCIYNYICMYVMWCYEVVLYTVTSSFIIIWPVYYYLLLIGTYSLKIEQQDIKCM